jgi:hypothetical protein
VGAIYDVVESDDSHIVWKFTGTTGDWAFVFVDGRIVVASTVDFNIDAKDTLTKELNDVMNMLNAVFAKSISTEARSNALNSAVYYASNPEIYHKLKHDFNGNIDLTLVVPDSEVETARLDVTGQDTTESRVGISGQHYYIDDIPVLKCEWDCRGVCLQNPWCTTGSQDITDKILPGLHRISGDSHSQHTMILEVITSSKPSREFVLYGPNYAPWINETSKSMTIDDMNLLIAGNAINTTM